MSYTFDPSILREYDIRGIVGKTLSTADAKAVGQSFGSYVRKHGGSTIAVGYDGRLSSPSLESAMVEGLTSVGIKVTRIGIGPTPMLYFATRQLGTDAGVMITGSHNPPDYNGFKMVHGKLPIYGATILELGRIAAQGEFAACDKPAPVETKDVKADYLARLARDYTAKRGLKVAWDAGNGATGEILKELVKKLPGEHHVIFADIDGRFPNHHPDPTVAENLVDLQKLVKDKGCDLGIGFDGDGDRIGAVDANGRIIPGDMLLALYAGEVLKTHPGATIVADVKSSQVLFDEVARLGGKPVMWKTGHSLLKAKMAETNSPLSGEISGHIMFGDKYYGFDDALYCAVRLVNLIATGTDSLGQLFDRLPKVVNTPEIRLQVDESRKFAVIDEIRARLKGSADQVNEIDGVRVTTKEGWWLLRASNTQDAIIARAEAFKPEALARLLAALSDQLGKSGVTFAQDSGHHHAHDAAPRAKAV